MRPVRRSDGSLLYDIIVRSEDGEEQVYRTQQLLSRVSRKNIIGRGTRVWKAIRFEHGSEVGDSVALKESWVDDERPREGTTVSKIMACAVGDEVSEIVREALLTVITHGDAVVEGARDYTRPSPARPDVAISSKEAPVSPPSSASTHHRQVHYRIVFKEVCRPLTQEKSLAAVFQALADIVDCEEVCSTICPPSN